MFFAIATLRSPALYRLFLYLFICTVAPMSGRPSSHRKHAATAGLPVSADTSIVTDSIVTAAPSTSYITVPITQLGIVTEVGGEISTSTFTAASLVTDPAQFSSLAAVAANYTSLSSSARSSSSSSATATASTYHSKSSSSSHINTVIPAVVVSLLVLSNGIRMNDPQTTAGSEITCRIYAGQLR